MRNLVCLNSIWLGMSVYAHFMSSVALAQVPNSIASPADDFVRGQAEQNLEQRLRALSDATPNDTPLLKPDQSQPQPVKGRCFDIKRVNVEGVSLLARPSLNLLLKPYQNTCIGLADINSLLKSITNLYVEKGYITSRVYVPEQNISGTKVLRLVAAEGALSDVYLNGKPTDYPGLLGSAFPGLKGKPVNIRDVEQGLDQINRLSSNNAKTTMLPGKEPGTSILNVENKPDKPWSFSLTNNNLGQKSTGYSKSAMALRLDNLFKLNDLIALTYERSGPDFPWPHDGIGYSNSISGSFSVPYGYWTLTTNGSYYKYRSLISGNFNNIDTSGNSSQFGLNVDRVILRDQHSITTLNMGLIYKETNNFVMGNQTEVGSRQYTVGNLGLSHSRRMLGGLWVFDANYAQGLGMFGSVKHGTPGAGDADPTFSKFSGTMSVNKPFEVSGQNFQFSSMVNGQYSPDNMFGAEQISLGGYSSVRGTRDNLLFGNNGFFIRNELVWRTKPWANNAVASKRLGEFRPYVGLDYGQVFKQSQFGIEGGDVAGWTVGARLAGGNISADIGFSQLFKNTNETGRKNIFFISTSLKW